MLTSCPLKEGEGLHCVDSLQLDPYSQSTLPLDVWNHLSKTQNVKAVYCHPAYLTYMQSTSRETLASKKLKLALEETEKDIIRQVLITAAPLIFSFQDFYQLSLNRK